MTGRALIDGFGATTSFNLRRASGTAASPSAVAANDAIGSFGALGYGATGYSASSRATLTFNAAETWTDTAHGTYFRFLTCAIGGTTLTERLRIGDDGSLTIRANAQVLADANGLIGLRTYTVATLPSASNAARLLYVSDESGGAVIAFSDGTNWRRVTDRAIVS